MQPFKVHRGLVAPLDRRNVDTDAIIPGQFCKRVERTGFGEFLFYDWRFDEEGKENPNFVLNKKQYQEASILLTKENFGCGSSREHAPWAIKDYGFDVIIASSFADIFYNNCIKNSILPITLNADQIDNLFKLVADNEQYYLTVDLKNMTITGKNEPEIPFYIYPFHRKVLLEGLDDVSLTLQAESKISDFEATRSSWMTPDLAQN